MPSIARRLLVIRLPRGAAERLSRGFDQAEPSAQQRLLNGLLARVYAVAGPADRARMVEALMRPLGLLSLAAVANGLFVSWRLRSRWGSPSVPADETARITAADVAALADHAQQLGADALDGLVQVLMSPQLLLSSASAAVLLVLLLRRTRGAQRPGAAARDPDLDP